VADRYVSDINNHLVQGQSIVAKITEIDGAQERFSVNLRNSINFPQEKGIAPSRYEGEMLKSLFVERDLIVRHILGKGECSAEIKETKLVVGQSVAGAVKQVMPYGILVELDSYKQIGGLLLNNQIGSKTFTVGDRVDVRVLDYDMEKKIVDLSLNVKLIPLDKKIVKMLEGARDKGKVMDAKIESIKENYAIVMLREMSNCLMSVTVNTPNSNESSFLKFKEGQCISIVVAHVPADLSVEAFNAQKVIGVPRSMKGDGVRQKEGFDVRKKLNTPIDASIEYLDQLTPGTKVNVRVKSIKSNQLNVEIASNLPGRIHVTELCDDAEGLNEESDPFAGFKSGDIIEAKVVGFHDIKTNTYLPLSKPTGSNSVVVDFTLKKSDLALDNGGLVSIGDARHKNYKSVEIGDEFNGFVQKITSDAVWVYLGPTLLARAFILECGSKEVCEDLGGKFKVGTMVKTRVIGKDASRNAIDLTFNIGEECAVKAGNTVTGRVSSTTTEAGMTVQIGAREYGRVHLCDISDVAGEKPAAAYKRGDFVDCYVLLVDAENNKIDLSVRESRLNGGESNEIKGIQDVKFDDIITGYVKTVSDAGVFVSLNRSLVARVKISDLSDLFVRDWRTEFTRGMMVKGRVIGVGNGRIEMTLKASLVDGTEAKADTRVMNHANIKVGEKYGGVVTKVAKYGVFIRFDGSQLSGLCHIKEVCRPYR
jgi:rRNA biogenesis protein RRP5